MLDTVKIVKAKEVAIPALGLGTWQLKGDDCVNIVRKSLQEGYMHVDTAQAYENEEQVGLGIQKSGINREELFLTTKVWKDNFEPKAMAESVEESLTKLKTDYVNLLLLHWPGEEKNFEKTLDALMDMKEKGHTLAIGVSNYPVALLERAHEYTKGAIVVNQVEYHPLMDQERVLAEVRSLNMALTAYSPLGRGKALKNPVIIEIANHHKVSPSQVILSWLMSQDQVIAIPKASSMEHSLDNLGALRLQLSQADRERINALRSPSGRMVDPDFAPEWDQ